MQRKFSSFACVDWSGQNIAHPKGLAVAIANQGKAPLLIAPPNQQYWSRAAIRDWFIELAVNQADILIGLDLSLALPFVDKGAYFPGWDESPPNPQSLWALVDEICANDKYLAIPSFLQHPQASRHFRHSKEHIGDLFGNDPSAKKRGIGRLRHVEHYQRTTEYAPSRGQSASSFNLVGAAQVGKSSLTGMRVLHQLGAAIPIWPFDPIPDRGPVIVEIYTSIAAKAAGVSAGRSKIRDRTIFDTAMQNLGSPVCEILTKYDDHSTDALITSAWMRNAAQKSNYWSPKAMKNEIAAIEGWTFGII